MFNAPAGQKVNVRCGRSRTGAAIFCGVHRLLPLAVAALLLGLTSAGSAQGPSPAANVSRSPGVSNHPALAAGGDGTLHALWEDLSPGNYEVMYASRPPGGDWSEPENVSRNEGGSFRPAIVAAADGSLYAVWHDDTPGDYDIFFAEKPAGGDWSAPANISNNPGWSFHPEIALAADGTLHVAWHDNQAGNWEILYASRPPGGRWSEPLNLSQDSETSWFVALALEPSGTLDAAWVNGAGPDRRVLLASRSLDGDWSAPVVISPPGTQASAPTLAAGPGGTLHAVWQEEAAPQRRLVYSARPPGGPPEAGSEPQLVASLSPQATRSSLA